MLEEQLKKNEELQSMTEDTIEIKNELATRLKKIQHKQKLQMEGLAYILQNSGDTKIESLAKRILDNPYYDYNNSIASIYSPNKNDDNVSVASNRRSMLGSLKRWSRKGGSRMSMMKSPSKLSAFGGNNVIHEENENAEEMKEKENSVSSSKKSRSNASGSPNRAKGSKKSSIKRSIKRS